MNIPTLEQTLQHPQHRQMVAQGLEAEAKARFGCSVPAFDLALAVALGPVLVPLASVDDVVAHVEGIRRCCRGQRLVPEDGQV